MLSNIYQVTGVTSTGIIITYSIVAGVSFLFMILFFKLGLASVKSKTRKGFKWLAISVIMQLFIVALLASPFILIGFTGESEYKGPSPGLIIFAIILAIFLDLNIINVLHKTGLKRALLCFFLMLVPLVVGAMIGVLISQLKLFIPI